jgi:hypothetical protein
VLKITTVNCSLNCQSFEALPGSIAYRSTPLIPEEFFTPPTA